MLSYLSVGRHYELPEEFQPSLLALKIFNLLKLFNDQSLLAYKNYKKNDYLESVEEHVLLIDDDDNVLNEARQLEHVQTIDAKKIGNWELININYLINLQQ